MLVSKSYEYALLLCKASMSSFFSWLMLPSYSTLKSNSHVTHIEQDVYIFIDAWLKELCYPSTWWYLTHTVLQNLKMIAIGQDVFISIDAWHKKLCYASTWLMLDSYSTFKSKNYTYLRHIGQDVFYSWRSYVMLLLDWCLPYTVL